MTTDFRALCAELLSHAKEAQSVAANDLWFGDEDNGLFDRADAALAEPQPPADGKVAYWSEGVCGDGAAILRDGVMVPVEEVVAELNRLQCLALPQPIPVSERLPEAGDIRYEFSVYDEEYEEQAGGTAPTYAQALSEGRHYLAQYQQDGLHTLELRRVEVLPAHALPLPSTTTENTNDN